MLDTHKIENALAQEFEEEFKYVSDDYHYGLAVFEGVDSGDKYAVAYNEEEVKDACYEEVSDLVDDLAADALCWDNIGGIEYFVDEDWFKDALRESWDSYIGDIRDEEASSDEFENRLEEEMADYNTDDEDEFLEKLIDNDLDYYGNAVNWYIKNFGNDAFSQVVQDNNLWDMDAIVDAVIDSDGYGNCLATYDGEEYEINCEGSTIWAFKIE